MSEKTSMARHGDGGTAKPYNCVGDEFIVTSKKRKVSICHPEPPAKRRRVDYGQPAFLSGTEGEISTNKRRDRDTNGDISQTTGAPVHGLAKVGTQRNASSERETHCKRRRCEKPEEVRETETEMEVSAEQSTMMEVSADQLTTTEVSTDQSSKMEISCEISPNSSSPPSSQQNKWSGYSINTSRGGNQTHPEGYCENAGQQWADPGDPLKVLFMQMVAGGPQSVGKSAPVSLLDWYDLGQGVLLVMERPVPSVDLMHYLSDSAVPQVRIIDFGCGCFVRKRPYRRYSGTFSYAPQEFYMEGKYKPGPTTVWQLGSLLYELLDGYTLFTPWMS